MEQMWNLIRRTKGYLSQTQKLWQRMGARKQTWFQQWQEMSPLTNDRNGQRRQYPDLKESAILHLMAGRWGQMALAQIQIHILWLQHPCDVFLELENNPLPILGPATPLDFKGEFGGGNQNSSQTSSLEFDLMAGSGIAAPYPGEGPLVQVCSHKSTFYLFLFLMQTVEVMTAWLMILPVIFLTVKITLTSSAERLNFNDRSLQLEYQLPTRVREEGSEMQPKRWFVKLSLTLHPISIHSWVKVYNHGVKDDCTVRLGKWILRNEQVSHLSINRLTSVDSIKQVKGCII